MIASGIDITSRVADHLDLPERYRGLQLKDLMRHVSGLPDYFALADYRRAVETRQPAWDDHELLERALALEVGTPGNFRYSNIGYLLLRMILEARTGLLFTPAVKQLVFDRLGIADVHPLASVHDWEICDEATSATRSYDPQWVYPGTFLASPDALTTGMQHLLRGALFDPSLLFDAVAVSAPGHSFAEPHYGLGLMIDGKGADVRFVGHGGGGPGFLLFLLARPDGSAACLEYRVSDEDTGDEELIRAAVARLADQGTK